MTDARTAEELATRLPLGRGVRVAAAGPGGLVALDKPAGILTHPNRDGAHHAALLNAPYDFERECFHWTAAAGEPDTVSYTHLVKTAAAARRTEPSGRMR